MGVTQDLADYLARTPSDEETAAAAVAPYRDMTPRERLEAFTELLGAMDEFLAGREPLRVDDDPPFWMCWRNPSLGRPA